MRIYNSPQTSPTPSKKISNDDGPTTKSTTPKKLSLLQEKMLAYQTKAAEAEEVYTPTSHARRDTYQNANIDLKDRMAAWEKQPEPEIEQPVLEDVAVVEEEEVVVEEEPLSLADRMAKFKAQSSPDKFAKTKAQQEIEEAKRLKEEEELRLKKEEEERLKPIMVKISSRRASSEIQKRMAAWGEKVEEEPEVPAPIVEESGEDKDKDDADMEQNTPAVDDEPVTKSPRQAPYKRPADMPETSNLLKERMACWGGGAREKEEEEQSAAEEVGKKEVDIVDEIAARVAEMTEDKPTTDEVSLNANDEPKPQAERTTPRKSALLEAKLNAYTQAGATDENTDPSPYKKKPIDMPDVPNLTEKLSAYTEAGKADDMESSPKKTKPIDMPGTNSSLRDKMNAYKAGSTREFSRSAGATDLDPELSSSVLKSRMAAWEQGQVGDEDDKNEDDHVKEAELAHLLCSGALKEKMSEYTKAGAAHEQTEASAPTDLPPELSQNLLKEKLSAYKQVVSTPTEEDQEDTITKNVDVDEDTAALLSSAMALANEKRKHELLEIMRDRTLSKEARAERIYEKISCIRADDIIIDGETIETEEGSHQDIEDF